MNKLRLKTGLLIVLEGIDGAGKTTQAAQLHDRLSEAGWDVVRTKEPTDGRWGKMLRASAQTGRLSPEEELKYFIEDRREHVDTLINPALAAGKIVIVDRYYFSTAAYQGARGLDPEAILQQNETFAPPPHLLILLEVDPSIGVRRIRQRGDKENLFEAESSLRAVAEVFKKIERPYLLRVDGHLSAADITHGLLELLHAGPLSTQPSLGQSDQPTTGNVWLALWKASQSTTEKKSHLRDKAPTNPRRGNADRKRVRSGGGAK
ncbi:dTMP kinase [Corallococcus sp. AB011P]|uniref:dTMP kinase n=1 Tax=Corallococcus sp. AB011P TaxID=2316735 RepID=UPI001315289E|nr:dTMP kinase [Corallococcus sp. AB011P]